MIICDNKKNDDIKSAGDILKSKLTDRLEYLTDKLKMPKNLPTTMKIVLRFHEII